MKHAGLLVLWLEGQSRLDIIDVLDKSQDYNENNTTQCNPVIVDHHGENPVDISPNGTCEIRTHAFFALNTTRTVRFEVNGFCSQEIYLRQQNIMNNS